MYLLDTNIVSEPARPDPSLHVLQRLEDHSGELAIASVVWHELWFGVERLPEGRRRRYLSEYLNEMVRETMEIVPYDARAARWHARQRSKLAAAGRTPPFVDGQIAATAAVHDMVLVTRNTSDFEQFTDLRSENWFSEQIG